MSNKAKKPSTDQKERKEASILYGGIEEEVLGVAWNKHPDVFTFKVNHELRLF